LLLPLVTTFKETLVVLVAKDSVDAINNACAPMSAKTKTNVSNLSVTPTKTELDANSPETLSVTTTTCVQTTLAL